jgi:predicted transcriptional regulator of viral defense system
MRQVVSAEIKKGRKEDKPVNTRAGLGENLELVKKIVQEKGFVDSEAFAEASGKTKREALAYLCGTAKRGILVNISRGKYTLPKTPEQATSA